MGNESNAVPPVNVTPIDILPEPLKRVRELAKVQIAVILGNMFDNADDALFELADKATSNVDQTMYFDSMREVRIKREGMESAFLQRVQDGFRQLNQPDEAAGSKEMESGLDGDSLSLIRDDELEQTVAIKGMVSKVKNRCGESLQHLSLRFDHLVRSKTVTDHNNPLGPQILCDAFRSVCDQLALDIRAKLVVYKLFDKFTLGAIGELYDAANELLIEQGVMPKIKPGHAVPPQSAKSRAAVNRTMDEAANNLPAANVQEEPEDAEIFDFLRGLLSDGQTQLRQSGPTLPVADKGPVLSHYDLVQMLSSIQRQDQEAGNLVNFSAEPVDARQALHNLMTQGGQSEAKPIGRIDDDVMNLVSMLFEFILDDHNLPTPMKALLARLQIPMLKVAVLDNTFFSRGGHPARKLLNELAKAAMGWSESADLARDTLYAKVKSVVERVLDDFVDNVELFQQLLDEFTEFVVAERRRSDLIEQRTRDAEEGLGRTQRARAEVGDILNRRAEGKQLPTTVVDLLRDGWSNYLFLVHVKEGVESQQWQDAIATVDDLLWSVQPNTEKGHRGELLKMIPSLLQRLRQGLTSVSFNKSRMRSLFKDLEGIHLDCLKSTQSKPEPAAAPESHIAVTRPSEPDTASSDEELTGGRLDTAAATEIESPVIIENLPETPIDEADTPAADEDEYLQLVDRMGSGTWVEMVKQETRQRAKLAAVIRATGKYIFVNRVGMKVAEKTRLGLAGELREGILKILDDTLLFDRALESVIGHLREMKD